MSSGKRCKKHVAKNTPPEKHVKRQSDNEIYFFSFDDAEAEAARLRKYFSTYN